MTPPTGRTRPAPPRIGIRLIQDPSWTAGSIYIRNLLGCLAVLPEAERPTIRLFGADDTHDGLAAELRRFPFVDRAVVRPRRLVRLWRRWGRRLGRHLGAGFLVDPELRDLDAIYPVFGPPLPGVANIRWLPDLQHLHLPHLFTAVELRRRDAALRDIAAARGILVLSSEAARADFRAAMPEARIETRVWRFCSIVADTESIDEEIPGRYRLPAKYVYVPNQFWAHKNHVTVFRAAAILRDRGFDIQIVCTGLEEDRRDPQHMPRIRRMLVELGLTDRVRLLGLVPRGDQLQILRRAAVVVQPSLFEGWSTVVEDTKAVGRPLLVSDLAVHREQIDEEGGSLRAWIFPAIDAEALADRLAALWPELEPGPEPEAEQRAALRGSARRLAAARTFLDIVERAAAIQSQEGDQKKLS